MITWASQKVSKYFVFSERPFWNRPQSSPTKKKFLWFLTYSVGFVEELCLLDSHYLRSPWRLKLSLLWNSTKISTKNTKNCKKLFFDLPDLAKSATNKNSSANFIKRHLLGAANKNHMQNLDNFGKNLLNYRDKCRCLDNPNKDICSKKIQVSENRKIFFQKKCHFSWNLSSKIRLYRSQGLFF